ncbi:hypothetical protein ACFL96_12725 [Thermoproteota archaeon]
MSFKPLKLKPKFVTTFLIAAASDALDYLVIGLIPGISPIIDAATSYLLYRRIGYFGLFGTPEIVPVPAVEQGMDLIPLHTIGVIMALVAGRFK